MRRIMLASVLSMAVVMVAVAAGPAKGPASPFGGFPMMHGSIGKMVSGAIGRLLVLRSELNVTAEQRSQVRAVIQSRRPQIAEMVKAVRDKRIVLRDTVLGGEADEAQIRAAADDLGQAIGDAAVKAAKLRGELAPILTDKQRELIQEFLKANDAAADKFLTGVTEDE